MKTLKVILVLGLILGLATAAYAAQTLRISTIAAVNGTVEVKIAGGAWMPAQVGMTLQQGDLIRTMEASSATVNLDGNGETAMVRVKENSQMMIAQLVQDIEAATQSTLLDLALGSVLITAKELHSEKSSFEVKTPTSIVGVRGTTFDVTVEAIE
ncbi:FecR domain-containing protein [Candidatus Omnitrophota bacterium]